MIFSATLTISRASVWFSAKRKIGSLRSMPCVIYQNRLASRNFVTLRTFRISSKGHSQPSRRSRPSLGNRRSRLFLSHHEAVQFLSLLRNLPDRQLVSAGV